MPNTELLHIISGAGLEQKEAALYLAGLELGSAPASDYAQKTDLNRITAYNHLELLVHRGIFTRERRDRSRFYAPISPESLAVEARKNVQSLERALPELRALRGAAHRQPTVRFFEGWEGVCRVYEDTLTTQSDLLNFANSAIVRQFWTTYDDDYVRERVKRKIRLRGIAPDDVVGRRVHGEDRKMYREIRLVPAKDFDFNNEINIYDNKVGITSFGTDPTDLFGVIIESIEVANTQKQIFEMAWRYAGKAR